MELMESRMMFSVVITTTSAYVRIRGDESNNSINLKTFVDSDGNSEGGIVMSSRDMWVNGTYLGLQSSTVDDDEFPELSTKPWIVDLGDGNDSFYVNPFLSLPSMTIRLGAGKDSFIDQSSATTWPNLTIDAGSGQDTIEFGRVRADDSLVSRMSNLSIFGGSGRDTVTMNGVAVSRKLQIEDTRGPLSLTCTKISVSRESSIVTGNSIDHLLFDRCSFGGKALISTQGSDDTIYSVSSRFKAGADVFAGGDDDEVVGFD